MGILFASAKLLPLFLIQIHSYRNIFGLLITKALVNGCEAVRTIAPLSLISRLYCFQRGSNGITVSHLQAVVPSSVGQIAQHHVNTFVFNIFHRFKTISIDKAIRWQSPYGYDLLYVAKNIHQFLPLLNPIHLGQYQPLPYFQAMIRSDPSPAAHSA